jgi:DNA primase
MAETAIDALSYAALHPDHHTRYASTGGAMNPNQPALIASAVKRMGQGATIIIATDNDEAGRELADRIEAIAQETGREDLQITQDLPEGQGSDWNDVLRQDLPCQSPGPVAG